MFEYSNYKNGNTSLVHTEKEWQGNCFLSWQQQQLVEGSLAFFSAGFGWSRQGIWNLWPLILTQRLSYVAVLLASTQSEFRVTFFIANSHRWSWEMVSFYFVSHHTSASPSLQGISSLPHSIMAIVGFNDFLLLTKMMGVCMLLLKGIFEFHHSNFGEYSSNGIWQQLLTRNATTLVMEWKRPWG